MILLLGNMVDATDPGWIYRSSSYTFEYMILVNCLIYHRVAIWLPSQDAELFDDVIVSFSLITLLIFSISILLQILSSICIIIYEQLVDYYLLSTIHCQASKSLPLYCHIVFCYSIVRCYCLLSAIRSDVFRPMTHTLMFVFIAVIL